MSLSVKKVHRARCGSTGASAPGSVNLLSANPVNVLSAFAGMTLWVMQHDCY